MQLCMVWNKFVPKLLTSTTVTKEKMSANYLGNQWEVLAIEKNPVCSD